MRIFLLSLCLFTVLIENVVPRYPNCDLIETQVERRPVTKTRVAYRKNNWKFWEKKRPIIETYLDEEEFVKYKLVTRCCDGYTMSEMKICEPVCEQSCPQNAFCMEPNRCDCRWGYKWSTPSNQHCTPMCASACPERALCVAPNECKCMHGYRMENNQCVAVCEGGDGCRNGICVTPGMCICDAGFKQNSQTGICELQSYDDSIVFSTTEASNNFEITTEGNNELETVDDTTNWYEDYMAVSDNFAVQESGSSWTTTESYESTVDFDREDSNRPLTNYATSTERSNEIERVDDSTYWYEFDASEDNLISTTEEEFAESESDFVSDLGESITDAYAAYNCLNGTCHPTNLDNDEMDCSYTGCPQNAHCHANGTCECDEGYAFDTLHKEETVEGSGAVDTTNSYTGAAVQKCITLQEFQKFLTISELAKTQKSFESYNINWLTILYITLGVIAVLSVLIILVVAILGRQRGSMNVQDKSDLRCEYNSKHERNILVPC